jgi:hypothetical protein
MLSWQPAVCFMRNSSSKTLHLAVVVQRREVHREAVGTRPLTHNVLGVEVWGGMKVQGSSAPPATELNCLQPRKRGGRGMAGNMVYSSALWLPLLGERRGGGQPCCFLVAG